jgi:hypothetical protein
LWWPVGVVRGGWLVVRCWVGVLCGRYCGSACRSFLTDEKHPARPVLEALSWLAGTGGLVVAVVALAVAVRQGGGRTSGQDTPARAASQVATGGGVVFNGNVTGGSGSGATTGVRIDRVGVSPGPPAPARP